MVFPRDEVIRNTTGDNSFQEGIVRRESAEALYAGYDVEGFYTDEDSLGDGNPVGIWTSPHDETYGGYVVRNSLSPAVDSAGWPDLLRINLEPHGPAGFDPVASPANSDGCAADEYVEGEESVSSGAVPVSGWQIDGWTGTTNDSSTLDTEHGDHAGFSARGQRRLCRGHDSIAISRRCDHIGLSGLEYLWRVR